MELFARPREAGIDERLQQFGGVWASGDSCESGEGMANNRDRWPFVDRGVGGIVAGRASACTRYLSGGNRGHNFVSMGIVWQQVGKISTHRLACTASFFLPALSSRPHAPPPVQQFYFPTHPPSSLSLSLSLVVSIDVSLSLLLRIALSQFRCFKFEPPKVVEMINLLHMSMEILHICDCVYFYRWSIFNEACVFF